VPTGIRLWVFACVRAAWARAGVVGARVMILSAKYGLVNLDRVLEPYDNFKFKNRRSLRITVTKGTQFVAFEERISTVCCGRLWGLVRSAVLPAAARSR
jgi:hypothetical protein